MPYMESRICEIRVVVWLRLRWVRTRWACQVRVWAELGVAVDWSVGPIATALMPWFGHCGGVVCSIKTLLGVLPVVPAILP